MAAPQLCQSCSERRWAVILMSPLKYLCWPCYAPWKLGQLVRIEEARAE